MIDPETAPANALGRENKEGRADGDLPPHPRPPSALHRAPSGAKAQ